MVSQKILWTFGPHFGLRLLPWTGHRSHNDSFFETTRLRNQQKLASGTLHQCMHCQHVTLNIKQKMAADKYFERIRAESLCFFGR